MDLTKLTPTQVGAIATNFVTALGNPAMDPYSLVKAGMDAYFALTSLGQCTVDGAQLAYTRLQAMAKGVYPPSPPRPLLRSPVK